MALTLKNHVRLQIFRSLYTTALTWMIERKGPSGNGLNATWPVLFLFFTFNLIAGPRVEAWSWIATIVLVTSVFPAKILQLGILRSWVIFSYIGVGFTQISRLDSWNGAYLELPEYELVREAAGLFTVALLYVTRGRDYVSFGIDCLRYCAVSVTLWLLLVMIGNSLLNIGTLRNQTVSTSFFQLLPSSIRRRATLLSTRLLFVAWNQWRHLLAFAEKGMLSKQENQLAHKPQFSYTSTLSGNNIRLLVLQRRTFGKLPSCLLTTVALAEAPSYIACSYVWGSSTRKKMIQLEGAPLWISESLYQVIRRQQSFKRVHTLWVDAICIDQSNEAEKAEQIGIMRQIFQVADHVRAFVQPQLLPFSQKPMQYFSHQQNEYGAKPSLVSETNPYWKQLATFVEYPWFLRVWILQEAAVPFVLRIVNADSVFEWDPFIRRLAGSSDDPSPTDTSLTDLMPLSPHVLTDLPALWDTIADPNSIRTHQTLRFLSSTRRYFQLNGYVPLWYLLCYSSRYQSTDIRDRIFALLGLTFPDAATQIGIEYHLPMPELYARTAEYILRREANLSFLALARGAESIHGHDLPSWVPSWRNPSFPPPQLLAFQGRWAAANALSFESCELARLGGTLVLRSINVDTICKLGLPVPLALANVDVLVPAREFAAQAWLQAKRATGSDEHVRNSFQTTIAVLPEHEAREEGGSFADFEWAVDLYGDQETPPFRTFGERRIPDDDVIANRLKRARQFAATIFADAKGKNFTVTEKGSLAMIPAEAEVGDEIHLMPSAEVAFVLRPIDLIETDDATQDRRYKLVNWCYLSGAMNGQLVTEERQWTTLH